MMTRSHRLCTQEGGQEDFVNILNDQADLYSRASEIDGWGGAPMHSMTATSQPFIVEPPAPFVPVAVPVPAIVNSPVLAPVPAAHVPAPVPTPVPAAHVPAAHVPAPVLAPIATAAPVPAIVTSPTPSTYNYIINVTPQYFDMFYNTKFGFVSWYIFKFSAILMAVSFGHWVLVSIYMKWCYEPSIVGIFANIFMVSSPLCAGINNLQQSMSNNFISFWMNGIVMSSSFVKGLIVM